MLHLMSFFILSQVFDLDTAFLWYFTDEGGWCLPSYDPSNGNGHQCNKASLAWGDGDVDRAVSCWLRWFAPHRERWFQHECHLYFRCYQRTICCPYNIIEKVSFVKGWRNICIVLFLPQCTILLVWCTFHTYIRRQDFF